MILAGELGHIILVGIDLARLQRLPLVWLFFLRWRIYRLESFDRRLEDNFGAGHREVDTSLSFGVAREAIIFAFTGIPEADLVGLRAMERGGSHPLFLAWFVL